MFTFLLKVMYPHFLNIEVILFVEFSILVNMKQELCYMVCVLVESIYLLLIAIPDKFEKKI